MADLRVSFAGLELKNPVIISSEVHSGNLDKMRECEENGAAAVTMRAYSENVAGGDTPSTEGGFPPAFSSTDRGPEVGIDTYAEELERVRSRLEIPVFPALCCVSVQRWIEAARRVEAAGAEAVELDLSRLQASTISADRGPAEIVAEVAQAVRETVELPLVARCSPLFWAPPVLVETLERSGVDGMTLFGPMSGLEIDVDEEMPVLRGFNPAGDALALRYPLRWVSQVYPRTAMHLALAGGVGTGEDVVKCLLAGARAVQIGSTVVLNGYPVIGEILGGLREWMEGKGYERPDCFRGKAAEEPSDRAEGSGRGEVIACIHRETHAPCVDACPAHVPAQAYVERIARRDFEGAVEALRAVNPFQSVCGWVCFHPCEWNCTRGDVDEPIAIRALKRFAIEWGQRNMAPEEEPVETGAPTGRRVAVVGAGPAGLTAAHDLARFGHDVTVMEASERPGGVLRWFIPAYRLPRDIVDREIEQVRRLGVEIQCGRRLGRDVEVDDLVSDYDAVVLAYGTDESVRLEVPGEDASGVVGALEFLRRVSAGQRVRVGNRVAVAGGGGSALDSARTALRLGAEKVYVVYRRSREEMPINEASIDRAEREGVRIIYLAMPVAVEKKEGRVDGLRIKGAYLDVAAEGKRRPPVPVAEIEYVLDVDRIIVAVSQSTDMEAVDASEGVEFSLRGSIKTLDEFGRTTREGVFAAGDVAGEGGGVIYAVASGRRTALGVDTYLKGEKPREAARRWGDSRLVDKQKVFSQNIGLPRRDRLNLPLRPEKERIRDFEPVELPLSEEEAVAEARRCLRCGCGVGCGLCYRLCPVDAVIRKGTDYAVDPDHCTGCGLCVQRCPLGNIETVPGG